MTAPDWATEWVVSRTANTTAEIVKRLIAFLSTAWFGEEFRARIEQGKCTPEVITRNGTSGPEADW
jgi:hypothetical protein